MQMSLTSFQAEDNPLLSRKYIDLIDAIYTTEQGRNIFRQKFSKWVADGAFCSVLQDQISGKLICGALIVPDGTSATLTAVVTRLDYQRQGHARRVVLQSLDACTERNLTNISLQVRLTRDGLAAAHRLYEALGFVLQPGIEVIKIKNTFADAHLLTSSDPGGVFRTRLMHLKLPVSKATQSTGRRHVA